MTPTLTTAHLVLRPLTKASQRQVDWLRDPKVTQFSEQRHVKHSLASCLRYIQACPFMWAIYDLKDRHIGNLTAHSDIPNNIANVGIMIGDTDYWGRGWGTEAWRCATAWLLDKEGGNFRKLEAGCMAINIPMRRVLDHTGFRHEGERLNHFLFNGAQACGEVFYGKFR